MGTRLKMIFGGSARPVTMIITRRSSTMMVMSTRMATMSTTITPFVPLSLNSRKRAYMYMPSAREGKGTVFPSEPKGRTNKCRRKKQTQELQSPLLFLFREAVSSKKQTASRLAVRSDEVLKLPTMKKYAILKVCTKRIGKPGLVSGVKKT